jgi:hypothetical protein
VSCLDRFFANRSAPELLRNSHRWRRFFVNARQAVPAARHSFAKPTPRVLDPHFIRDAGP